VHPFLKHPTVLAFAHRGDQSTGPENTLSAFEGAAKLGFKYLETDVHATADGKLVAFHDQVLDRVSNTTGLISEKHYDEIKQIRIGLSEKIPLLEDLLGYFPNIYFNIDPKSNDTVEPLINIIKKTNSTHRVCIGSFSDKRLIHIRNALPDVCTSMGPREVFLTKAINLGFFNRRIKANCIQIPHYWNGIELVNENFVKKMKNFGWQVHVWTINSASEMNQLLDIGVNGIMSDDLLLLKNVLNSRGQWSESY
tara:strand:+ start:293 stop:1048 length:756 start_codon:yes stop_codon:yes gene_type:complete